MTAAGPTASVEVERELLDAFLRPYFPHCRYLKDATVAWPERPDDAPFAAVLRGTFGIAESCYIEDTGHLNSVEANICFNQAYYVLVAQCLASEVLPALRGYTVERFRRRHLPDVLIHDLHTTFKRPIDRRRFTGEIAIADAVETARFVYFRTWCGFHDERGGLAKGDVTLALMTAGEGDAPAPGR